MSIAEQILKNAELTGDQIAAIKSVGRSTWETFFEAQELQHAMRLTGTDADKLSELKETVKGIQSIKNKFLAVFIS